MPQHASNTLTMSTSAVERLRAQLPEVADRTVAAVIAEVPSYATAFGGSMGVNIARAVQTALGGFLLVAARGEESDPSAPLQPALDAAYALGRGEARSGRTVYALLAAYRVGARVAWREMAAVAVEAGLSGATLAQFAELVFAYIDELSAASVSGHADELAASDRVRQRYRDRLTRALLAGDPVDVLQAAATSAEWEPPTTLTAVVLPSERSRGLRAVTDRHWLVLAGDAPAAGPTGDLLVCLVPDLDTRGRAELVASLTGRVAVVGPARPWAAAHESYERAVRARRLTRTSDAAVDTEEHLAELVTTADPGALADLRAQVLAPLAELREVTADKLVETLRVWLLHQGRREDVAAALFVHPQTVRYRMTQLRELYGDALGDPTTILALTVALGAGSQRVD